MTIRRNSPTWSAAVLTAQSLTLNAISLFTTAFIVRRLGALQYGEWATASSLAAAHLVLTNFGLRTLFVRDLARRPDNAADLLAQQLGLRLCLGVIAAAVAMMVCLLLRYPPVVVACMGVGCVWILVSTLGATLGDVLQSMERFGVYSSIGVASGVAVTVASVVAVLAGSGPVGLAVAYLAAPVVGTGLSWREVRKHVRVTVRCDWSHAKALLTESRALGAGVVIATLRDRAEQLLVPRFVGLEGFGVFSAGTIVADRFAYVPDAIGTVFYPRVSRDAGAWDGAALSMLSTGLAACAPMAVIGLYAAHAIAAILLPGHSQTAASVIQVTVLSVPLLALGVAMSYSLQAAGHHERAARAGIGASIASAAVTLTLVATGGIVGASWSVVARQAIVALALIPVFRTAFPGTLQRLPVVRILVAAAALTAVCRLMVGRDLLGVAVVSAAGLVVYATALMAMRVFAIADVIQALSRSGDK